MPSKPSKKLDTFPNPAPGRDFHIHMQIPEFTCLCPLTGQPDFATLIIDYVPDRKCVELKSLKLYAWSYRNEGAFHEKVTNAILDDIVAAVAPRCGHCDCPIIGHGVEEDGAIYCCAHCARQTGATEVQDRA